MARYCFYCGRELKTGEKCNCKHRATAQPDRSGADSDDTGQNRSEPASARQNGSQTNKRSRTKQTKNKKAAGKARSGQKRALLQQQISQTAHKMAFFLAQPADQIRLYAKESLAGQVIGLLFFQAAAAGLFFVQATEQAHLRTVFGLSIISAQKGGSWPSRLFLFMQGLGISLTAFLLLILLYQLLLRYVYRQAVGYYALLSGLSTSCFFAALLILSASLLLAGSFFSALLVLAVAYAVSLLAQALALRTVTGLSDNQVFILVALAAFIWSGIMAMFLNLSLPVLNALLEQSIII